MATKEYVGSNGKATPIDKLADTHLVNIIRKMERNAELENGLQDPIYPELIVELAKRPEQTRAWYAERKAAGK